MENALTAGSNYDNWKLDSNDKYHRCEYCDCVYDEPENRWSEEYEKMLEFCPSCHEEL